MTDKNDPKFLSKQRYGHFAQAYVSSPTHAKGDELNRLIEIVRPKPDWIVLDIATGGGHTALRFTPFVSEVIATDITLRMLEAARTFITGQKVENIIFNLADAEALPFKTAVFDLVTCRIAPHHFSSCSAFVQESARVLKASGLLMVQDLVLPEDDASANYVDLFEKMRDPSHNRAFKETEWKEMFRTAGLLIEHTEKIIKRHRFVPWAERQKCSPEVIKRLINAVEKAPEAVINWMLPLAFNTPEASFVNHHIIIAGRKT